MEVFFTDCNLKQFPKCEKQPAHSKQGGTVELHKSLSKFKKKKTFGLSSLVSRMVAH